MELQLRMVVGIAEVGEAAELEIGTAVLVKVV